MASCMLLDRWGHSFCTPSQEREVGGNPRIDFFDPLHLLAMTGIFVTLLPHIMFDRIVWLFELRDPVDLSV